MDTVSFFLLGFFYYFLLSFQRTICFLKGQRPYERCPFHFVSYSRIRSSEVSAESGIPETHFPDTALERCRENRQQAVESENPSWKNEKTRFCLGFPADNTVSQNNFPENR